MSAAARRAARAVHERMVRTLEQRGPEFDLARITQVVPTMTAELFNSAGGAGLPLHLEEGADFYLTQLLRWWDRQYALQIDDVLVMVETTGQDWIAFDVRTDRDVGAGVRMNRPPVTYGAPVRPLEPVAADFQLVAPAGGGTVTWTRHITHKMEVFDSNGVRIGWLPVFTDLP